MAQLNIENLENMAAQILSLRPDGWERDIHFDLGKPGSENVISGMRSNCDTLIYLDIQKCLDDDIEIFISENNVVLTAGINGVLEPKYFLKIVNR